MILLAGPPALATAAVHAPPTARSAARQATLRPPSALDRLESAAEDLGDAAARGGWREAESIGRAAARDVRSLARRLGAPALSGASRHLAAARAAVRARRELAARFAANALSGEVVGLYARYRTAVPLDVMRLDVQLREVQLEARAGDPGRVRAAVEQVEATWRRLAPTLPPGAPAVVRFAREVRDVAASAGGVQATVRATDAALEGVDGLEALSTSRR